MGFRIAGVDRERVAIRPERLRIPAQIVMDVPELK
jgi:hypothetical protein